MLTEQRIEQLTRGGMVYDPISIAASIAVSLLVSGASYAVGRIFAKKPPKPSPTPLPTPSAPDPLGNVVDVAGPLPCLLGYRRVGSKTIFSQKINNATYIVMLIAGHPVVSVPGVYVDNKLVSVDGSGNVLDKPWASGSSYSMNVRIYTGSQTTSDATLDSVFTGWTADHIGTRLTYAIIKIDPSVNASAFQTTYSGGIPDFSFDVIGGVCYDPRDGTQSISDRTTWKFSNNASIVEANYLIHECGMNEPTSVVDWASVTAAANIDDQAVTLANGLTERRYTSALYWTTDETHETVLERAGTAHAGGARFIGKKWVMFTGAFPASAATIGPDDYAGTLSFSETPPLAQRANGVRGQFTSPLHNFEMRDFPAYQNTSHLAEDGNHAEWLELKFDAVTSPTQAQRLARIAYNKARFGFDAEVQLKPKWMDLTTDDLITVNDSYAGLSGATFRIMQDTIGDDFTVSLSLEYEISSFYDWTAATDEKDFIAYSNLTGTESGLDQMFGAALIDSNGVSAGAQANAVIWASPSPPANADHYRFYRNSGSLLLWTGAAGSYSTTTVTGSSETLNTITGPGNIIVRLCDAAGVALQSITLFSGGQAGLYDAKTEANTPYYTLPAASKPQIKATYAGSVRLRVPTAPGARAEQIELWSNTSNNFGTATLVSTVTNSNAEFSVTGTAGTYKFYWARVKNATDTTYGPQSNPLLVVFS